MSKDCCPISRALRDRIADLEERRDGRSPNHVSVVLGGLRAKLADFGWVVVYSKTHCGLYGVLREQKAAFRAALTGEGPIAYPALAKARLRRIA